MAGKKSDLPGRKFSVWVSGEHQLMLGEQNITPGEAIGRGLEAHDRVPVPPEVRTALRYLSRLAAVGASSGLQEQWLEGQEVGSPHIAVADVPDEGIYQGSPDGYWVPAQLAEAAVAELNPPGMAGTLPPAVKALWEHLRHGGNGSG
jgi:hypothetical protein